MKIGELAKHADVNIDTIRYYEQRELLPRPMRSASGYRSYGHNDVLRLKFIVQAKEMGFTLKEIGVLLSLQSGTKSCEQVRDIAQQKSADIALRIEKMTHMKQILDDLAEECAVEEDVCPILKVLEGKYE